MSHFQAKIRGTYIQYNTYFVMKKKTEVQLYMQFAWVLSIIKEQVGHTTARLKYISTYAQETNE